jgi:hypothetical protein
MSLYGPRINLPKVDIPSPSNPSWNLDKEKKILIFALIAIVIIVLMIFLVPPALQGINDFFSGALNPAVQVSWKNNPLDLTKEVKEAEMDVLITNTTKEIQNITFNITTPSQEIIIFCPNSIYDSNKSAYLLENVAIGDKRRVPCIVRRNPNESVFTGSYTIDIITSAGNTKTTLEIISK